MDRNHGKHWGTHSTRIATKSWADAKCSISASEQPGAPQTVIHNICTQHNSEISDRTSVSAGRESDFVAYFDLLPSRAEQEESDLFFAGLGLPCHHVLDPGGLEDHGVSGFR